MSRKTKIKSKLETGEGAARQREAPRLAGLRAVLSGLNPIRLFREPRPASERFAAESLAAAVSGRKLDQYRVGQAEVFVSIKGDTAYYEVSEPGLSDREQEVYKDLREDFYYSLEPEAVEAKDPMRYVEGAIWKSAEELGLVEEVRRGFAKYRYFIERDTFGFGKLHILMVDPDIEEITAVRYGEPVRVIHKRFTEFDWLTTNIVFHSEMEIRNYNQRLAQQLGKTLTAAVPMVDATSERGDRFSFTFGDEVTHPGSSLTVRKHPREPLSLAKLVENGTLSPLAAAYLWQVLEWRGFVDVLGAVGSGKTTLLNSLLASVSPNRKMVTAEDTLELSLPHENWHRFHTRVGHFATAKEYDIDLFDLVKEIMRHRPDYIAVGEVRGAEIKDLTHAASLGHSCASTFHADSPEKAMLRMKSSAMGLSDGDLLLIWCFPLTARIRMPGGKMVYRLIGVHELNASRDGKPELRRLFNYDSRSDSLSPKSASEVVGRSERLTDAAKARRVSRDELVREIERKAKFLKTMVRREELDFRKYTERIREFYGR